MSPARTLAAVVVLLSIGRPAARATQEAVLPPALDASSPVPFFVAQGSPASGFKGGDRDLARWAIEAWQRASGGTLRFEPVAEPSAILRLYWVEPNGEQFGETESFALHGRRGASVYVRPDTAFAIPDIAPRARRDPLMRDVVVYLTCLHEVGHALGLSHTREFRDIMYFFGYGGDVDLYFGRYRAQLKARDDIARVSGLSDRDVSRVRALYPGR